MIGHTLLQSTLMELSYSARACDSYLGSYRTSHSPLRSIIQELESPVEIVHSNKDKEQDVGRRRLCSQHSIASSMKGT
jgi:hypothetical protein